MSDRPICPLCHAFPVMPMHHACRDCTAVAARILTIETTPSVKALSKRKKGSSWVDRDWVLKTGMKRKPTCGGLEEYEDAL